jgi:putative phage-type endonuclease
MTAIPDNFDPTVFHSKSEFREYAYKMREISHTAHALQPSELMYPWAVADSLLGVFLSRFGGGVKQRSPAWYAARARCIGGSELATLRGENPYARSTLSLFENKLGIAKFSGGPACDWGTTLEPMLEICLEHIINTKTRGTEVCIPSVNIPGLNVSPDGYAAVPVTQTADGFELWTRDSELPPTGHINMAVEFKAPYSRQPGGKRDKATCLTDRVPKQYRAQLQAEMEVSRLGNGQRVVDHTLFVDAKFCRCAIEDLYRPGMYNDQGMKNRPYPETEYASGFIAIYAPPINMRDEDSAEDWAYIAGGKTVDFGGASKYRFEQMLRRVCSRKLRAEYYGPYFSDERDEMTADIDELGRRTGETNPREEALLGFFPWKLFEFFMTPIAFDPNFLPETAPMVAKFLNELHGYQDSENPQKAFLDAINNNQPPEVEEYVDNFLSMIPLPPRLQPDHNVEIVVN